jgi:hypothetical protein
MIHRQTWLRWRRSHGQCRRDLLFSQLFLSCTIISFIIQEAVKEQCLSCTHGHVRVHFHASPYVHGYLWCGLRIDIQKGKRANRIPWCEPGWKGIPVLSNCLQILCAWNPLPAVVLHKCSPRFSSPGFVLYFHLVDYVHFMPLIAWFVLERSWARISSYMLG